MAPARFRDPMYTAVENLPVGFQVVDFDWRYIYVNPAAAAHARRPVGDLEGKSMLDVYPDIESTAMFRLLERCMNDRVADEFENLFTFPDGDPRWFDIRVEPVPEGICIYSNDIHDRKVWQLELEAKARTMGVRPPMTRRQWQSFIGGQVEES